jgi:DNA-binding LacI/PurR family transcriptional regulator
MTTGQREAATRRAGNAAAPSAHDVARIAGVSQAAVSRAFTPGASISHSTREKVIRAAQSLGYRPNLLARSLIKGASGIVGVVIGHPKSVFFLSALDALSSRLSRAQKHILVFTSDGTSTADGHVEDLLKYRVDALLLMGTSLSGKLAEHCRSNGVAVIFFNLRSRERKGFASVAVDNRGGARQLARHMLQQGYRRFGLLSGPENFPTSSEREAAFLEVLAERGTYASSIGRCYERAEAREAARTLLSAESRPDAIFCWNDHMALAALEVARFEFKLEIGRDLGIAGFGDIEQACWPSFSLTTYSQPVDLMMDRVAALLTDGQHLQRPLHNAIEGQLRVRDSTQR